uniref:Uncharacterized protein n=1 Tax=Erythrolobus australicus TaxID=1077150 RepID=A0A7S1TLD6_9RHOD|mmetsp:Transcript_2770/g.7601  ORF Transcript_2770/g.7601 Transcript_2770/m.7601 type:complete len:148 (+) Transcript_2770:67-510(+)
MVICSDVVCANKEAERSELQKDDGLHGANQTHTPRNRCTRCGGDAGCVGYNVHMRAAEAYCAEMRNGAGAGFKAAMSDEDYAENHNGARGQSGREIAGANVRAEWQTADVTRDAEAAAAAVDDANSKRAAMVAGQRRYLLRHGEWVR